MTIFEATQRVSNIVKSKFGCTVEFYYAPKFDTDKVDPKAEDYFAALTRNFGAKFVICKGAILIPVFVETEIFGCVEIKGGDLLDPNLYDELHNFLDSTLRDFIIKRELLRRLKIQESTLLNQKSGNVIPIFKKKESEQNKMFNFVGHRNEPLKSSLFISGNDYSRMRDLAVEIHDLMGRNSFVPYSILDFKRSFMEEMAELGNITIFIPEITDLPAYEIEDITNYLETNITPSCPFLIVSSQKSLEDLEREALIPEKLIEIFKRFRLELNEDYVGGPNRPHLWDHEPSPEIH